jgi:hypothetical protein
MFSPSGSLDESSYFISGTFPILPDVRRLEDPGFADGGIICLTA